ncbi:MAG: hypothetical protein GWN67_24690 [Phycisphaerae bacterium]|nr:hypothetical protein [Phycisphaerae bacterium]NIP53255.1 hypothetical protein [Phycisphaerae bacterium]NIS52282.1 hypothetical protein [Phycisphaerae bacterium]NIU09827.1 hypothetical protein [Phycisphaerae bacterium]NIU59465.1 hypothetical protein [Phycisphaerae bacterium]
MEKKEKIAAGPVETAHKATKETEHFLNRWFNDSTKGWPVRSYWASGYNEHFANLPGIRCILS